MDWIWNGEKEQNRQESWDQMLHVIRNANGNFSELMVQIDMRMLVNIFPKKNACLKN